MKNYRNELMAAGFLIILLASLLFVYPWQGTLETEELPMDALPTPSALVDSTTDATGTLEMTPTPFIEPVTGDLVLCGDLRDIMCIVSMGVDNVNGNSIFSLNVPDPGLINLYLFVWSPFGDRYTCYSVSSVSGLLYCSGKFLPEGAQVTIDVHRLSDDQKLASGAFTIPVAQPIDGGVAATPGTSYPSYPSYP